MVIIKPLHVKVRCYNCLALLGVDKEDIHPNGKSGFMCKCISCEKEIDIHPSIVIPKAWIEEIE